MEPVHMVAPNDLMKELWQLQNPNAIVVVGKYQLHYTEEQQARIQLQINQLKESTNA